MQQLGTVLLYTGLLSAVVTVFAVVARQPPRGERCRRDHDLVGRRGGLRGSDRRKPRDQFLPKAELSAGGTRWILGQG